MIGIDANESDMELTTSSGPKDPRGGPLDFKIKSYGYNGVLGIGGGLPRINVPGYLDVNGQLDTGLVAYATYPWHRNGSLNYDDAGADRTAMLDTKKISNLRYATRTFFFEPLNIAIWDSYDSSIQAK
jgi:hypothetical protein